MGFLAPAFLVGALAVGLPVYLHLLRRNTSPPRPFSSLMFFELRQQSATRRRRLRYWLLLALRVAVVLLLVLAFAEPYFKVFAAGAEPDKLLLAVRQPGGQRVCAREQSGAIEQAFSAPPCRVPGRADVARPKQALCQ